MPIVNPLTEMISSSGIYEKLSRLKFGRSSTEVNDETSAKFLKAQQLSYQCAIEIGRQIRPGWTEKETANLMDQYLRDYGVKTFFHQSFAWFGHHSRFTGFNHYWKFLPTNRVLHEDDVIILDTAPMVNGFVGDIGFAFSLKPHNELIQARKYLVDLRSRIPELFKSAQTAGEVWVTIDNEFRDRGYDNCHKLYPFGVLGHRVHYVPQNEIPGILRPFAWQAVRDFLKVGIYPDLLGKWHSGDLDGYWAIEPHVGANGFGSKFEEILVIDQGEIYWLDEKAPIVNWPEGLY